MIEIPEKKLCYSCKKFITKTGRCSLSDPLEVGNCIANNLSAWEHKGEIEDDHN